MAHDHRAVHETRGLARRDAVGRLRQLEPQLLVAPGRGADGAVDRPRAVAELDAVHALAGPSKLGVTHSDAPPREVLVVADDDAVVAPGPAPPPEGGAPPR